MRPIGPRAAHRIIVSAFVWLRIVGLVPAADAPKPPPTLAVSDVPKDVEQLRVLESRVKEVAARVLPCTVALRAGASQGSGVIVTKDGHIATAGHVITKPGEPITVMMHDGKTLKGVTLGFDRAMDSGLVKITDPGPWPHIELAASNPKEGTWCVAVGHPFGFVEGRPPVVRLGRVLSTRDSAIRSDCSIVAGDSGGPLVDLGGKVIGINSRIGGGNDMNYHVPVETYRQNWDKLAAGQQINVDLPGRDHRDVKAPFRAVVDPSRRCVVRVKCDGKDAALGTIVGPQGWVLTKASELRGAVVCRLQDGRELPAQVFGIAPDYDLAMLKIDAAGLPMIPWGTQKPGVGQWVAAPGLEADPLSVGVISVPERRIPPPGGALGVVLGDAAGGAKVTQVLSKSPAEKAGFKIDDVITHVNDKPTPARDLLVATVKTHRPGQTIKVTVLRGGKKFDLTATLAQIETPSTKKRDMQNTSGTGVSRRHDDFPLILQHDSVLQPVDCGGPLVDLSGQVIGVNIARAGRTETYTVSSEVLLARMYDLMSGRLAPPPKPQPPAPPQKPPVQEAKKDAKPEPKNEEQPAKRPPSQPKPAPTPPPQATPKKVASARPSNILLAFLPA